MKKQLIIIHGGDTFDTYEDYMSWLSDFEMEFDQLKTKKWKEGLEAALGDGFEVIAPRMPNSLNAKYAEWKIWFEKFFPVIADGVALAGHSLGGIFLAKYLSENRFPRKIRATFLVASPYDTTGTEDTLADFVLPKDLSLLAEQGGPLHFYFSKDDDMVPIVNMDRYKKALPSADFKVFTDRGHFTQESFPELVEDIRKVFFK